MRRDLSDSVAGDIVRQRLDALMAEIAPHRADVVERDATVFRHAISSNPTAQDEEPESVDPFGKAEKADLFSADTSSLHLNPWQKVARAGWNFGRQHFAVVAIIALLGVAYTAWTMQHAATVPVATAVVTPSTTTTMAATPTPATIQVHVLGAVNKPGVVRLPEGARVVDAIEAAGGLNASANPGQLNLAAVAIDGSQIIVGDRRQPGGHIRTSTQSGGDNTNASTGQSTKVNLNTATVEQLESLPGIGPVTAKAIVAWRTQHKRFNRIEELQEIDGIGPKTYQQIAPHVRV